MNTAMGTAARQRRQDKRAKEGNAHTKEMDALLEKDPPLILWEKNRRGVMVAVEIHDPHAERSVEAQAERLRAAADRYEQEEARKAAALMEQRRLDTTRLMISARTSI